MPKGLRDDIRKQMAILSKPKNGPREFTHEGRKLTLNPMKNEDDPNGYWDGKTMGNGKGRSFYSLNGKTYYTD